MDRMFGMHISELIDLVTWPAYSSEHPFASQKEKGTDNTSE